MFSLSYGQMFALITIAWVMSRVFWAYKKNHIDLKRECRLLTVYICLVVIARIVYFPWHHENGHIGLLNFDAGRILPFWLNLRPFVFLSERYDGWKTNVIGNIAMFIPVGLSWPFCFKKLDSIRKTLLAGSGLSLFIEISQLLFYERGSDIDDLILNTTGVLIGALIYFAIVYFVRRKKEKRLGKRTDDTEQRGVTL